MSAIELLIISVTSALITGSIGRFLFSSFLQAAAIGFAGSFLVIGILAAIAVQVRRVRERSSSGRR